MKKIHAYYLTYKYYNFLRKNNLNEIEWKGIRPYIGFVGIQINNIKYVIPLTSKTKKHLDGDKEKLRYAKVLKNNKNEFLGTLLINKMIPVINDDNFIIKSDITLSENLSVKDFYNRQLIAKELNYLNQPDIYNQVHQLANEIYTKRFNMSDGEVQNCTDTNIKFAVDFKQAELLMYKYAFNLVDKGKMKDYPLLPDWIAEYGEYNDDFREIHRWMKANNIDLDDEDQVFEWNEGRFYATSFWIVRKDENHLVILEERFDLEDDDNEGMYQHPQIINEINIKDFSNLDARQLFYKIDKAIYQEWEEYSIDPDVNYDLDDSSLMDEAIKKLIDWDLDIVQKDLEVLIGVEIDDEEDEEREM